MMEMESRTGDRKRRADDSKLDHERFNKRFSLSLTLGKADTAMNWQTETETLTCFDRCRAQWPQ
jgi:hypothetical protein